MENTNKQLTCIVTGHRPQGFPFAYGSGEAWRKYIALLDEKVEQLIGSGYSHFIAGGAIGVDTDFALAVIHAKSAYPHITLELALPCPEQERYWAESDRAVYYELLELADSYSYISQSYTRFCMHKRNEYMVDNADLVLAVWSGVKKGGTYSTIKYAQKKVKQLTLLNLCDI